jgi:hypothetical protein
LGAIDRPAAVGAGASPDERVAFYDTFVPATSYWGGKSDRCWIRRAIKIRAKTAYGNFLTLWKDTDQEIPIFNRAKAEYAEL